MQGGAGVSARRQFAARFAMAPPHWDEAGAGGDMSGCASPRAAWTLRWPTRPHGWAGRWRVAWWPRTHDRNASDVGEHRIYTARGIKSRFSLGDRPSGGAAARAKREAIPSSMRCCRGNPSAQDRRIRHRPVVGDPADRNSPARKAKPEVAERAAQQVVPQAGGQRGNAARNGQAIRHDLQGARGLLGGTHDRGKLRTRNGPARLAQAARVHHTTAQAARWSSGSLGRMAEPSLQRRAARSSPASSCCSVAASRRRGARAARPPGGRAKRAQGPRPWPSCVAVSGACRSAGSSGADGVRRVEREERDAPGGGGVSPRMECRPGGGERRLPPAKGPFAGVRVPLSSLQLRASGAPRPPAHGEAPCLHRTTTPAPRSVARVCDK